MAINVINSEDYKYRFDLAAAFKSDDIGFTAENSGFLYMVSLIEDELKKRNLLSSLFVEFNLVGTILAPDTPNKLNSLVYIREGDPCFADKIKKYSDSIIEQFVKERKYTLFFHPEVFLDPQRPQVCYSIINDTIEEKDIQYKDDISKNKKDYYTRLSPANNIFIGKASFDRDYYTILEKASKIREKGISVNEELSEFHKLYHYVVGNNVSTAYVTIPILGAQTSNRTIIPNIENIQGQGVLFLFFTIPSGTVNQMEIVLEEVTRILFLKLGDFVRLISYNYLFNLGLQLQKKAKDEAIKSAKAAIMSRNMSHNLGSHVMSYLKQHLGTVKDMINDKILSELVDGELDLTKTLDKNVDTIALPFLLGLGHFISYLQERQDFIATIATDYIPYYSTINFKDDVYDVLNPDKRAERHPERDKTSNMKMDNILLGNIARSEGLGRPTRPTEVLSQTDGITEKLGDIVLRFGKSFNGNVTKKGSNEEKDLQKMRDVNFSLPGGIVGRQALFSILENITRNAAKHGKWHKSGKLQLTFNIYDRWSDIPIDDNDDGDLSLKEVFENFYFSAIDKDDLFYVTVTDNCEICAEDLAKLRVALQDEYIDYMTGVMKDGNKGLKEMRISSAWIRSLRDESVCYSPAPRYNEKDTDEKKKKIIEDLKHDKGWGKLTEEDKMIAPLLYARIRALRINNVVKNRNLQYIFCVPKPRKVAIISDIAFGEKVNIRLINNCWRAFTKKEFENESNKSFEFILCDETDEKNDSDLYNVIRPIASSRVYKLSQIEGIDRSSFFADVCNLVSSNDDYKKKLSSYEELLYKKLSSFLDGDIIRIEDDRTKDGVSHEENEQEDEIKMGNVVISGTPHPGKYIYRTHHEAYTLFEKFMISDHSETAFVEGISGNNSTDRLIRNEEKNNIWFYRHLHAIKQQVAVFDERLYSRIGLKSTEGFSKDHIAITYLQRGVYVFTLVEDQNSDIKSFGLYGISLNNGNPVLGEKFECLCDRLATLTYNKVQGLVVEPTIGGAYILCKFDFISIHQGLLDKLYHSFGIKKQMLKQEVNKEKIRFTNQFYLYFCNSVKDLYMSNQEEWLKLIQGGIVEPWNDGFVPGFVIHSGRSKPGENDMPQQLPFLQYAAIEHAILDCKYSLVELLDYARYEK